MRAMLAEPWVADNGAVFSSTGRKARVSAAMEVVLSLAPPRRDIAIAAHGGVGAPPTCPRTAVAIDLSLASSTVFRAAEADDGAGSQSDWTVLAHGAPDPKILFDIAAYWPKIQLPRVPTALNHAPWDYGKHAANRRRPFDLNIKVDTR